MRIAILANADSIHTIRWANALAERRAEVHLFTVHSFGAALSAAVHRHKLAIAAPWGYVLGARDLRRRLNDVQPSLLHAHYASGYGTLARLSAFRPLVLSVWGSDVYDFPHASRWHRRLIQSNLRCADMLCSTSHVMAEQCRTLCPELRDICVTPFGVDIDSFRPANRPTETETITVGTVKTLSPKYGMDTLIQGFAACRRSMRKERPEIAERLRLRIVGGGPQHDELEKLACDEGISDVTTFVGAVPHDTIPRELNRLDIYVAVSRLDSESFGVAVVEASACGLPVVVSDVGGLPEVVLDGETGFVVPRDDPRALADSLRQLLLNPDLRSPMGAAGRRFVVKHYDWSENVARMEAAYARTLTIRAAA
jgi:glycosyltransferase involved in cell wall biosynthesis